MTEYQALFAPRQLNRVKVNLLVSARIKRHHARSDHRHHQTLLAARDSHPDYLSPQIPPPRLPPPPEEGAEDRRI